MHRSSVRRRWLSAGTGIVLGCAMVVSDIAAAAPVQVLDLLPVEDVYVDEAAPDSNFATMLSGGNVVENNLLRTRSDGSLFSTAGRNTNRISFLKFSFAGLPATAQITGAVLNLFQTYTQTVPAGTSHDVLIYRLAHDGWNEDSLTWNSAEALMIDPLFGAAPLERYRINAARPASGLQQVDLLALADGEAWSAGADLADGLLTLAIVLQDTAPLVVGSNTLYQTAEFPSSAGYVTQRPFLAISYVPLPPAALLMLPAALVLARRRRR